MSVKHLNPRQGITTAVRNFLDGYRFSVKHLNPRQGITTEQLLGLLSFLRRPLRVKHLNPRQGITTRAVAVCGSEHSVCGVKHLNPRQGITTLSLRQRLPPANPLCETPKSPPGDYNGGPVGLGVFRERCETPKSPPGDYNLVVREGERDGELLGVKHLNPRQGITTHNSCCRRLSATTSKCETPKSPPGDYNLILTDLSIGFLLIYSVKHLNPRQGITTLRACLLLPPPRAGGVKHLNPRQGITTDGQKVCNIYAWHTVSV